MRIQPRQQILDIWRSLLATSYRDGVWHWGGRDGSNAISDAEQLLCLLHPMNEIDTFALHDPDSIRSDVLIALRPLGSATRIPREIVDITAQYFERHTDSNGEPLFAGGGYFQPVVPDGPQPTQQQRDETDIVDAYAMSVTLCLAVLAFARMREPLETHREHRMKLSALRDAASRRLTAAMVGLLRSFVVNSIQPDSPQGQAVFDMMQQSGRSDNELHRRFQERFRTLRAQVQSDVRLAVPEETKPELDELFECGWTWGVAEGAQEIDVVASTAGRIAVSRGVAIARPYLYFTVAALTGIVDLLSRRTRALDLLDDDQLRLAEALQLRWDLTQRYWSTIARFDPERWPLEDIPWRTSDGEASDYFSLLVASVLIDDLAARVATEADLLKVVGVLSELAQRGRITRRMSSGDVALGLHVPGVRTRLLGSGDTGPDLAWYSYDYAPLLLKLCCQATRLTSNVEARERLMAVAEAAMDHLRERRIVVGREVVELWDDVSRLQQEHRPPAPAQQPSWYLTARVVEALVTTSAAYSQNPPRSAEMFNHLLNLLNEADHIYNQELMEADADDRSALRTGLDQIGSLLDRARSLQNQRTNTAIALTERALRLLDELALARSDAERWR